jgi:hypothetical protein
MKVVTREYSEKNCSLDHLADAIEEHLQAEGYEFQNTKREDGCVVQAGKAGVFRDLLAADRAFTVTLTGEPGRFKVSFGIGKWAQNLAMAFEEGIAPLPIVFFVEVPISLWSFEIEREFWGFVEKQVELRI